MCLLIITSVQRIHYLRVKLCNVVINNVDGFSQLEEIKKKKIKKRKSSVNCCFQSPGIFKRTILWTLSE